MMKPVAIVAFLAVSQAVHADTLILDPDPNSFLLPQPQTLTYPDQAMRVSQSASSIDFNNPTGATPNWFIRITAPTGQPLQVGCYERTNISSTAQRASLFLTFESRSCSVSNARFKVLDVQRIGGTINSFAADFVAPCGNLGRVVRGRLRYNSAFAIDTPGLQPAFDVTGTMSVTAAPGAIGGGSQGSTRSFALNRSFVSVSRNGANGASINYDEFVVGGSSQIRWNLDFAGPNSAVLQVGSYPNATRYPFQGPGVPGLSYTFSGSGCNQVFGSFNVSAITYDAVDGIPLRLSLSFQHRCETQTAPVASGTISYDMNALGPTMAPNPEIAFASSMERGELVGFYTPTCDE